MHSSNINSLAASLVSLGFSETVDMQLQCHICFAPMQFDIVHSILVGQDQAVFTVRVERDERNIFSLKYYTACLRKRVEVAPELEELDRRMAAVDWEAVVMGRQLARQVELSVLKEAAAIVEALQEAGIAADILRYKYWQGTALDSLIQFLPQHKTAWEISERFYFFNEADLISFNEAIRFLNGRWMERQLHLRKKQAERSTETEPRDSGRNLLLKKKPRASVKKNLLKK